MQKEKRILKNYLLYFSTLLLTCIIGITNIFADTTIDTSTWVNVTGRNWSITGQEFYSGTQTFNNDVLLNYYNVTGGVYTPPNQFDYITYSFFEHSTSPFNPCNSTSKFTATFKLLFTTPSFVNYVDSVKWGNENCSISNKNTTTGWLDVSCIASPSTGNYTDIFVNYTTISGTATSNLYITRNIDIACGLNTDAIINNDNANTQNIINNNNNNTQNIIDNNNQNTQDIIESNKVCNTIITDYDDSFITGYRLSGSGTLVSDSNYAVSDFISINNESVITIYNNIGSSSSNVQFFSEDKSFISSTALSNLSIGTTISVPSNSAYARVSVAYKLNRPVLSIRTCKNGNQALDDSISNLDDTINDDDTSGAESEASEFFSSFDTETFGLTSIITAPLNLIRSVLSSTCTDLQLPLPYLDNKKLTLPCMSTIYNQFFGPFFTIYQTITYGIIAYWVCVRIFNQVKDFKNPEHDEIEVMDL